MHKSQTYTIASSHDRLGYHAEIPIIFGFVYSYSGMFSTEVILPTLADMFKL